VKVDFEDGWLIKSSFITKDDQDQSQQKNERQRQKNRDRESGPRFLESISNTNGTESPKAKKVKNNQQL
jgi:hypothetical protein